MQENEIRKLAVEYAKCFIGRFYIWGGDDPSGFDCSGLVIEVLKAVGVLPRVGDWRAQDLFNMFDRTYQNAAQLGDLVFWRNLNGAVVHVEMLINPFMAIGASGGGSATKTVADAISQNAFIKIRPIDSRPGPRYYCDPYKRPHYKWA